MAVPNSDWAPTHRTAHERSDGCYCQDRNHLRTKPTKSTKLGWRQKKDKTRQPGSCQTDTWTCACTTTTTTTTTKNCGDHGGSSGSVSRAATRCGPAMVDTATGVGEFRHDGRAHEGIKRRDGYAAHDGTTIHLFDVLCAKGRSERGSPSSRTATTARGPSEQSRRLCGLVL